MAEFRVERSSNGVDGWEVISTGITDLEVLLTSQGLNVTKYYRVVQSELDFDLAISNVAKIVILSSPELTASGGAGEDRVRLFWTDVLASGYNLYRYDDRTYSWKKISSDSELFYSDVEVQLDKTYWYYVAPISSDNEEGFWSNLVSASLTKIGVIMSQTRSSQHQGIQFGFETTPGTLVPTTVRFVNFELDTMPKRRTSTRKQKGLKGTTAVQNGKQHTEASFSGILDFSLINYLLELGYGTVTPATANNGVTRFYNPSAIERTVPRTGTFEVGSLVAAEKFGFAFLQQWGIKWGENELSIDGQIMGSKQVKPATMTTALKLTVASAASLSDTSLSVTVSKLDGTVATGTVPAGTYFVELPFVNPLGTSAFVSFVVESAATITTGAATLTVTALAAAIPAGAVAFNIRNLISTPAEPADVGLYISTGGSSWTLLSDVIEGEISFNNLRNPQFFNDPTNNTFTKTKEGTNDITASLTLEDDTEASNFVGFLEEGQKIYLRFTVSGSTINASPLVRHVFELDIPMYVVLDEPGDKDGAYGTSISFEGANDPAFGLFRARVVSRISVL